MQALRRALDRAADTGRPVRFWLRDDDAEVPSGALDRLLGLCGAHGVPVTLAVIPARTGAALAVRLDGAPGVSVAVHGWAHANHAPRGQKSRELGDSRDPAVVLRELARGLELLQALHPGRALPVLVPPWNRIGPKVAAGLPGLGFRAVSVFRKRQPGPLPQVNACIDPIDWRGGRHGRDLAAMERRLLANLWRKRPVGVLTHHLVHDAAVWGFLERLFVLTCGHPGAVWVPLQTLVDEATTVSMRP